MKEKDGPASGQGETPADPSLWRGLTRSRLSRRQVLASAGTGAGALGLSAFLAACGVKGNAAPAGSASPAGGVGTAAWWAKQQLHHTVNFANWPYYLDVLKGKHPSLEHFTQTTGIKVNYTEPISDNVAFYAKIRPSLAAKQYTGFDIIVMTDSTPNALGYLLKNGWLIPLDQSMMTNFRKHASKLVTTFPWDKGNKYTMAWQSGFTTVAYNSSMVTSPGDSVDILFDKKYAGKIGMSGDIFQANLNSKYADLKMMVPQQGMMFWTDNMCIPLYAQNPKDAMALMDYYYAPDVQAVVEYYNDYVCPVPGAQQVLLNPTGWAAQTLKAMKPEIGLPTSVTANAPTVFPTDVYLNAARNYFPFKTPEELTAWNNLFVPITQGS